MKLTTMVSPGRGQRKEGREGRWMTRELKFTISFFIVLILGHVNCIT